MIARIGVFLLWLLHFLPFRLQVWLGNAFGLLLYPLAGERRKVAHINLGKCFPEMGEAERRRLVRRHFQAFGRSFIERGILWWSSAARIERLVQVNGWEHYQAVKDGPVIFLVPHFVALDVAATWSCIHMDGATMYSTQKNQYLNDILLQKRLRFGKQRLYSRHQGLRPVIKALREGLPFFYLPDQDQGARESEFVPFFGVPAATLTALSRLASMTGARVVPLVAQMLPGAQGYRLQYYPAWEHYPSEDVLADTRRMNEFIERRVLEMPEQYFWVHKRFKTRPEGEARFY